jgi:hypothetical protein
MLARSACPVTVRAVYGEPSDDYLQPVAPAVPVDAVPTTILFKGRYTGWEHEPQRTTSWRPLSTPATLCAGLYTCWMLVLGFMLIHTFSVLGLLYGTTAESDTDVVRAQAAESIISIRSALVLSLMFVVSVGCSLSWWLWRSVTDLTGAGVVGLPLGRRWAVAALIPFLNVIVVALLASAAVRLSRSVSWHGKRWQVQPGVRDVLGWVFFSTAGAGAGFVAAPSFFSDTPYSIPLWAIYTLLGAVALSLVGCVSGSMLLWRTSRLLDRH